MWLECRSSASQQQRQPSGRHTRGRKCSRTVLSHGPAEGSQCSLLLQTSNHITQAPAALVQAGGRHSTALETREEGALAIAPPKAADGGRHGKPAQAGAGPGSARAARDGTWGNAASRTERHWRQDGPGQQSQGQSLARLGGVNHTPPPRHRSKSRGWYMPGPLTCSTSGSCSAHPATANHRVPDHPRHTGLWTLQ